MCQSAHKRYDEAALIKITTPPTIYKPSSRNYFKYQPNVIKGLTNSFHSFRDRPEESHRRNKSFLSAPETSIDQIKDKIQGYLTFSSETSPLNKYSSDAIVSISQKTTQQQFRISIFRNNAKKRLNLRLIDTINPERYGKLSKQVNISEACINIRTPIDMSQSKNQEFLKRKHRNRLAELKKKNYQVRRYPYTRRMPPPQMKMESFYLDRFREATPRGWEEHAQPWRKDEEGNDFLLLQSFDNQSLQHFLTNMLKQPVGKALLDPYRTLDIFVSEPLTISKSAPYVFTASTGTSFRVYSNTLGMKVVLPPLGSKASTACSYNEYTYVRVQDEILKLKFHHVVKRWPVRGSGEGCVLLCFQRLIIFCEGHQLTVIDEQTKFKLLFIILGNSYQIITQQILKTILEKQGNAKIIKMLKPSRPHN